jgi:hypothetical protein
MATDPNHKPASPPPHAPAKPTGHAIGDPKAGTKAIPPEADPNDPYYQGDPSPYELDQQIASHAEDADWQGKVKMLAEMGYPSPDRILLALENYTPPVPPPPPEAARTPNPTPPPLHKS